jgi:hypothetical protein
MLHKVKTTSNKLRTPTRDGSSEEFHVKRVSVNTIRRWAAGISEESAKETLASLKVIADALLSSTENSFISELTTDSTTDSSVLSDTEQDEGRLSTTPSVKVSQQRRNLKIDESSEKSTSNKEESQIQPMVRMRRRKIAIRPVDKV